MIRSFRAAAAVVAGCAVAAAAVPLAVPAAATAAPPPGATAAALSTAAAPAATVPASVPVSVVPDGLPALLGDVVAAGPRAAAVTLTEGRRTGFTAAGVADVRTGRVPGAGDRWRVASVTKPFVATVVLQLVGEGRLRLDQVVPVGDQRPTVRQLLQHTSGLADYHDHDGLDSAGDYVRRRFENPSARESIALALPHSPVSAPGAEWHYTDTNYRMLELLIPRVTGRSAADEVTRRILRPLHLTGTYWPRSGDPRLRGPHLHGYMPADLPGEPYGDPAHPIDFTTETVDQTGAAGALVSTGPDLLRFLDALTSGRLLPPALLTAMTTTVPVDEGEATLGATGYGLGLERYDLGCGTVWGHGGSIRGYTTLVFTDPARHRGTALVVTSDPVPPVSIEPILATMKAAVCRG